MRIPGPPPPGGRGLMGAGSGEARPVIVPGGLARAAATVVVVPAGSGSAARSGRGAIVSGPGGRGVAVRGLGDDGGVAGRCRPPAVLIGAGTAAGRSAVAAHAHAAVR